MTATNSTAPAPTRYYAVHNSTNMDLHGWDESKVEGHKQKDFRGGRFVHVIDRTTTCCVACGMPENIARSANLLFCTGPMGTAPGIKPSAAPAGGWITGGHPASPATPIDPNPFKKYLSGPADDCHTEEGEKQIPPKAPPAKSEKVIAESAKPTTGVDWEAHKQFMRGL
jgi:hypothetical protein